MPSARGEGGRGRTAPLISQCERRTSLLDAALLSFLLLQLGNLDQLLLKISRFFNSSSQSFHTVRCSELEITISLWEFR